MNWRPWVEGLVRGVVDPLLEAWREYRRKREQKRRSKEAGRVRSADDATRRMRKRAGDGTDDA